MKGLFKNKLTAITSVSLSLISMLTLTLPANAVEICTGNAASCNTAPNCYVVSNGSTQACNASINDIITKCIESLKGTAQSCGTAGCTTTAGICANGTTTASKTAATTKTAGCTTTAGTCANGTTTASKTAAATTKTAGCTTTAGTSTNGTTTASKTAAAATKTAGCTTTAGTSTNGTTTESKTAAAATNTAGCTTTAGVSANCTASSCSASAGLCYKISIGNIKNLSTFKLSDILSRCGVCPNTIKTACNGSSAPVATTPSTTNTTTTGTQTTTTANTGNTTTSTTTQSGITAQEQQMVDLVNAERVKAGLSPLTVDISLTKVARIKAQDMITNDYFSHTSPTYGSPFDMMKSFGISYRSAGENIAINNSVANAHTAFMNSPGHRANILNSSFTKIGIGIVSDGNGSLYISQMFIG